MAALLGLVGGPLSYQAGDSIASITINHSYSRSNNSHEIFTDRWKWSWGKRNTDLRNQFNLSFPKYMDTIQDKLFNMNVKDGPKRIEDFE